MSTHKDNTLITKQFRTAGIIIIGDEVLSAKVVDENGPYLIKLLRYKGIDVKELRIINDTQSIIADAVKQFSKAYDVVITTGGIGPTHDDLTIESIAKAFDVNVIVNEQLKNKLIEKMGEEKAALRHRMTLLPEGGEVEGFTTEHIPILWMKNVLILPGIPSYAKVIMRHIIGSWESYNHYNHSEKLLGVSESVIAEKLGLLQEQYPNVGIGSYPKYDNNTGRWSITITFDSKDESLLKDCVSVFKERFINI